jgi:hypothetical protein
MWRRLKVLLPGWAAWRRLALTALAAGLLVGAFCFGRWGALSPAAADPPRPGLFESTPPWAVANSEYDHRAVAYIFNNIPITRADLGEYLIARYGPERIDFLVNRRIIDHECQAKGITVTDAEVEAQLAEDLRSMGITKVSDFVNTVLRRFNKTLYEYREDVIRPKLAMIKLVRPTITISDQDLQDAFEANWGPKVHCRMIVLPKGMNDHEKNEIWDKARKSEEAFREQARNQFIKQLAANDGDAPPIHRHFGSEEVEKVAFSLKPGEVSGLLGMKDGTTVILWCVDHVPPDTTHTLDNERINLHKQVMDVRLLQKIPEYFKQVREQANPQIFLSRNVTPEDVMRRTEAMLRDASRQGQQAPPAQQPPQQPMPPAPHPAAASPVQGN